MWGKLEFRQRRRCDDARVRAASPRPATNGGWWNPAPACPPPPPPSRAGTGPGCEWKGPQRRPPREREPPAAAVPEEGIGGCLALPGVNEIGSPKVTCRLRQIGGNRDVVRGEADPGADERRIRTDDAPCRLCGMTLHPNLPRGWSSTSLRPSAHLMVALGWIKLGEPAGAPSLVQQGVDVRQRLHERLR